MKPRWWSVASHFGIERPSIGVNVQKSETQLIRGSMWCTGYSVGPGRRGFKSPLSHEADLVAFGPVVLSQPTLFTGSLQC